MFMELKLELYKELVKQGVGIEDGRRVWNIAKRLFLFSTPEQAQAFLKLRNHPRYQAIVVQKEIELLNEHKNIFQKELGNSNFNLIDMGCADGSKANVFLRIMENENVKVKYIPISVSDFFLDLSLQNIKKENFKIIKNYQPFNESYELLDEISSIARSSDYQRNVILLLGSILGSFDINEYLFNVSNAMFKGDYLIIGNGIRKGERLVNIDNYRHTLFNEWFMYLMKSLGFDENEIEYDVRFNHVRVEGFYRLKTDKKLKMDGKTINLRKGDEVLVAVLYKYYEHELKAFCEMYFSDVRLFKDKDDEYTLVICRK